VALLFLAGCAPTNGQQPERPSLPAQVQGPGDVAGVIDGDTILVDDAGTATTVRLLGIDTPETVDPDLPVQCFGPQASARTDQLLTGQQVWLETDPNQPAADTYGRTLAYVWLSDDQLVNLQLIEEGYAREYTYDDPYRYRDTFQAVEAGAIHAGRGLWSAAACPRQRQPTTDCPRQRPAAFPHSTDPGPPAAPLTAPSDAART